MGGHLWNPSYFVATASEIPKSKLKFISIVKRKNREVGEFICGKRI